MNTPPKRDTHKLTKLRHGQRGFVSQINSNFARYENTQGIRRGLIYGAASTAIVGYLLAYNGSGNLVRARDTGGSPLLSNVIGWTTNTVSNGQEAIVQSFGILSNPREDLSGSWPSAGELVYLSPNLDGGISDENVSGVDVILGIFLDEPDVLILPRLYNKT